MSSNQQERTLWSIKFMRGKWAVSKGHCPGCNFNEELRIDCPICENFRGSVSENWHRTDGWWKKFIQQLGPCKKE